MPAKSITVLGMTVEIQVPYSEGHTLNSAEASVLNQTFAENVRNNTAKQVKEKLEAGDQAGAAAIVAKYASEYVFNERTAATAVARTVDPVEKEALAIAKAKVHAAIEKKGGKVKDYDKEQLKAKIAEVAAYPNVRAAAEAEVAAKNKRLAKLDDIEI